MTLTETAIQGANTLGVIYGVGMLTSGVIGAGTALVIVGAAGTALVQTQALKRCKGDSDNE